MSIWKYKFIGKNTHGNIKYEVYGDTYKELFEKLLEKM